MRLRYANRSYSTIQKFHTNTSRLINPMLPRYQKRNKHWGQPMRSLPCGVNTMPFASTSRSNDASVFKRSISSSGKNLLSPIYKISLLPLTDGNIYTACLHSQAIYGLPCKSTLTLTGITHYHKMPLCLHKISNARPISVNDSPPCVKKPATRKQIVQVIDIFIENNQHKQNQKNNR